MLRDGARDEEHGTELWALPLFSPGAVPDGDRVQGTPLTLTRGVDGEIELNWGQASCLPGTTDYEVYEGDLGDFTGHESRLCSTGGARSATLLPRSGSSYYLVVPSNQGIEGSYGTDSNGVERTPAFDACKPQELGLGCE